MIGHKLKQIRQERNLTLDELSNKLNRSYPDTVSFSKGKLSKWENNKEEPKLSSIRILADFYGIAIDDFYENGPSNITSITSIYNRLSDIRKRKVYNFAEKQLSEQYHHVVPLAGQTAANPTELSYGDTVNDEMAEYNVPNKADVALIVKGDSMEPAYSDGDIVFYKSQPMVENGEMAIVEVNGDGVTLKKVYYNYDDDKIILRSLNGKYDDRELNPEQVRVLGKVVK